MKDQKVLSTDSSSLDQHTFPTVIDGDKVDRQIDVILEEGPHATWNAVEAIGCVNKNCGAAWWIAPEDESEED